MRYDEIPIPITTSSESVEDNIVVKYNVEVNGTRSVSYRGHSSNDAFDSLQELEDIWRAQIRFYLSPESEYKTRQVTKCQRTMHAQLINDGWLVTYIGAVSYKKDVFTTTRTGSGSTEKPSNISSGISKSRRAYSIFRKESPRLDPRAMTTVASPLFGCSKVGAIDWVNLEGTSLCTSVRQISTSADSASLNAEGLATLTETVDETG